MEKVVKPVDLKSSKAQQILGGAKNVFLELGYEGASVEEIARRAGVSKGTLYNYFPDKRALFAIFVEGECEKQSQRMFQMADDSGNIEATLNQIAQNMIEFVVSPLAQGIFRVVVAESQRFPELGRAFYDSGPDLLIRRLAQYLAAATAREELSVPDPELAAHQFIEMCRAELFYKILLGVKRNVKDEEIQRIADAAVETFLQAFKPVRPDREGQCL